MQQFKYRKDVTSDELPFIESAYFACVTAQQALANTFSHVMGVDCLRRDDMRFSSVPYTGNGHDQHAWAAIRERLERYEVVLVGDRSSQPLAPVCRWKAQEGHPQGGAFEVTTRDAIGASHLNWLLRGVAASSARNSAATATRMPADLPSTKRGSEAPATVKRDFAVTISDEYCAQFGQHTTLIDGTRYKLVSDLGEVREGSVSGGKIKEAQLLIDQTARIDLIAPV